MIIITVMIEKLVIMIRMAIEVMISMQWMEKRNVKKYGVVAL